MFTCMKVQLLIGIDNMTSKKNILENNQEFAYKCIPQISHLTSLPVEVLLLLLLLVMVVLVNLEEKSCVLMWVSREKTLASLIGRVPEWVDG